MDSIGEQNTRVIPCAVSMLHQKVAEAIELDEPDWGKPREGVSRSLAWGSHRTILFAGLTYVLPEAPSLPWTRPGTHLCMHLLRFVFLRGLSKGWSCS